MQVLPDSGADISITGPNIIWSLNDHWDNLLPSQVTPHPVNGQKLTPISKLPVQIKIRNYTHKDELHIPKYRRRPRIMESMQGTQHTLTVVPRVCNITSTEKAQHLTSESLIQEFPSVLDSKVKPMEGKQFHRWCKAVLRPHPQNHTMHT